MLLLKQGGPWSMSPLVENEVDSQRFRLATEQELPTVKNNE